MLAYTATPQLQNVLIQMSRRCKNIQHSMLNVHWEIIDSILNKLQGKLQTIELSPLVFFICFGS